MNNFRDPENTANDYERNTPSQQRLVHGGQSRKGTMVNMVRCGKMIQTGRTFVIRVRIPKVVTHT